MKCSDAKVYVDRIHSGHQKMQKSLEKASEYAFWVWYMTDIREAVEKCIICPENSKILSAEKFKMWTIYLHTLGTL